jgi:signal transduction histidine kinase
LNRLGLAGRLILLIAVTMFTLQGMSLLAYLGDRRAAVPERRLLPFPDQLEAIVTLFDTTTAPGRPLLLRAFTDSEVILELQDTAPEQIGATPETQGDLPLPGLQQRLRDYSAALGAHEVRVAIPADDGFGFLPRFRAFLTPDRVRISVRLTDGSWLVLQRQRAVGLAIGGLPVGTLSALLATAVASLAMLAIWVETRPLRRMTLAVRRFARELKPVTVPEPRTPDLRTLVRAFNEMQEQLARADQGRTDMIAAFAHDVRTPLTRLTLRLRKLEPALQEAAARDIAEITRISDNAFRFASVDLAALDGPVDLRALVAALAERAGFPVQDRTPACPARLQGNAELLERALANLLDNARKYARGGRIVLEATPAQISLWVEDDGPGIPEAERARLMEPFERGERARTRGGAGITGSGLGLALARRIALRHGGMLHLSEAASGGLRVIIVLPATSG